MEKLKVKNFGPIKQINIKLTDKVLFIGPQSSGKSAISKLISMLRDPSLLVNEGEFHNLLKSFDIEGYLSKNTEIQYDSNKYSYIYNSSVGKLNNKTGSLADAIIEHDKARKKYKSINQEEELEIVRKRIDSLEEALDKGEVTELIKSKELEEIGAVLALLRKQSNEYAKYLDNVTTFSKYSVYIPSDRNLFSTILNSSFSLNLNEIPLPNTIKKFGALVEKARKTVTEFEVKFLNIKYSFSSDGIDIEDIKNKKVFPLSHASSGLQSVIPLLQVILSESADHMYKTYVVEEPELNLFPKAQYELLKLIVKHCNTLDKDWTNDLIITTHSPYCLSAINNMLMAFKAYETCLNEDKVVNVVPKESWIDPKTFSAYYMENGKASSIIDKETGLINDNQIDDTSYEIDNDFEVLLQCIPMKKA